MNEKLAQKLYKDAVKKAKDEMSDELFLGFYKKGQLTSDNMSKDEWLIHLEAIKEMEQDKSWGECEKAYSNGIEKIRADIESILENWTIDIAILEKGSEFYTMEISNMMGSIKFYHIHKWEVIGIRKYKNSSAGTRKIFEVEERNYGNVNVGKHSPADDYYIQWCFTDEEMLERAQETDVKFKEQSDHYDRTDPKRIEEIKMYKDTFNSLN